MDLNALNICNFFVDAVIALVSAVGNGFVLYVIFKFRRFHTVTNYLIANLAIADLFVGIIGIPCVLVTLFGLPYNYHGCLLMNCMIIISTQVSIFSLLTVAVERFIAIKHPFWYQRHVTTKVVFLANGINWILGLLVGLVPFAWNLGWNDDNLCSFVLIIDFKYRVYFNYFGFILTPLLIMFLIYCYIFHIVRKQTKQIAALEVFNDPSMATQHQITRKEMKAAKRFAMVIGLFAFSWIPLETMNMVTLFFGKVCIPCVVVAVWLSHMNSVLNPFLYAYGNSSLKNALYATMQCKELRMNSEDASYDMKASNSMSAHGNTTISKVCETNPSEIKGLHETNPLK